MRLYRGVAPSSLTASGDRPLKMIHRTYNLVLAETQALWAFAYLNNTLGTDEENVYWDTAPTSRFGKWQYLWGF